MGPFNEMKGEEVENLMARVALLLMRALNNPEDGGSSVSLTFRVSLAHTAHGDSFKDDADTKEHQLATKAAFSHEVNTAGGNTAVDSGSQRRDSCKCCGSTDRACDKIALYNTGKDKT